ncbi:hypothetical protein DE146DRAFT_755312 [Phaeosphaeria sp. MPI-PUGE-AT-0046c]|nr:hypothetical protein DE146DRAFT_755312 [Phaeosphaeria sp. MPI-PUGE-AT-0046c]
MEEQEDTQDLSSQDADDDFERRMIQNARDERRLKDALHGSTRMQAFRKARAHPHIGLTIENLERNNNEDVLGANAHVKLESPPSSSGSGRSDPAIHAPPGWGRKSRANRNWMRTITYEEHQQTTPPLGEDTIGALDEQPGSDNHQYLRRSIEDSPLSHKGTPQQDRSADWDLTFELNEASIIASTPYIPRNTMLNDIRQREVESQKSEIMPESPTELSRRPRQLSESQTNETRPVHSAAQPPNPPEKRIRTNSWQAIGKSQPVTGSSKENSPVAIYKTSTETVSIWEQEGNADSQRNSSRPVRHRREDSQDLLRRLARVSNTPSPRRFEAERPQTAPTSQLSEPSKIISQKTPAAPVDMADTARDEVPIPEVRSDPVATTTRSRHQRNEVEEAPVEQAKLPEIAPEKEAEDVDATPMPVDRPLRHAKTPVVTGAWVDTPGPRTFRKHISIARSPSQSPRKRLPRKDKSPDKATADAVREDVIAETIRPRLPSSALQALVQEAKAHGSRRQSADFGDSTINSLEDLISSPPEGEADEDTLQGLQIPTTIPRNEEERQRQQELQQLHRMNDRLRAARTSIRDASRGMKRVEDRVENGADMENNAKGVGSDCPCAAAGHQSQSSFWEPVTSLFWSTRLKSKRKTTSWRTLGGLTMLSILLLAFVVWFVSENIACQFYCHHPYADYSPYAFSVNPDAPQYPFVIPTLIYRTFFSWIPYAGWSGIGMDGSQNAGAVHYSASSTAAWATKSQIADEGVWDQSMLHDEVIR